MSHTLNLTSIPEHSGASVKQLTIDAPYRWLRKGWADFRASMGSSLTLGLLFVLAGYAITFASANTPLLTITFITGFLLIAPVFAVGFYESSRRLEQGQPLGHQVLFYSWQRYGWSVLLFGLLLGVVMVAWGRLTGLIVALALPAIGPYSHILSWEAIATPQFIALYMIAGFALAALVFAISVVSVPMLIDRKVDILTATHTSLRAVRRNPGVMALWAGIIAVTTVLSIAVGFLGLLITMPLLGHASWHAYRETVEVS